MLGDIDPTPDAASEWDDDPWWWPSARTFGIALMLVAGLAFGGFTIAAFRRTERAIEHDPTPTPVDLARIVKTTQVWQQRSAAAFVIGAVVLAVDRLRKRRPA
jgi:hypothetical protein